MNYRININLTPISIVLTCIFFTLKILGYVTWSWVWVFAPIWLAILSVFPAFVIMLVWIVVKDKIDRWKISRKRQH